MNGNPVITSIIYSALACAFLPLLGRVIDLFVQYVIGGIIKLITGSYNRFVVFYNYLTFPGVIWHEMSHAAFAIVTGAKVESISLFRPQGDRLGQVAFRTRGNAILRAIQYSLTSCAPVITGAVALYYFASYVITKVPSLPVMIIFGYLAVCVLMHMTMSSEDLKLYVRGIWFFFILFFILSMALL